MRADKRLEVGAGLGGELLQMTLVMGQLHAFTERAAARGATATVFSRFSDDVAGELAAYVEAAEPDTIVLDANHDPYEDQAYAAIRSEGRIRLVTASVLMVLTMLLSFTGYLLPDDQLGFWAVTVGTNMARATPLLGHEGPFGALLGMTPYNDVRFALLGGSIVDANALLRAYIWHCIAIPLIVSIFIGVHFWRVRKDGGISGPAPVMLESEIKEERNPRPVVLRPSGMSQHDK